MWEEISLLGQGFHSPVIIHHIYVIFFEIITFTLEIQNNVPSLGDTKNQQISTISVKEQMRNWSMPKEVKRQRIFWVHQNILNLLKHLIVIFVKLVLGVYMDPENIKYFIRLRSVILERFQSISRSLPSWSDGSGDAGSCSLGGWEAATGWSGDFWPDYKYLKKIE